MIERPDYERDPRFPNGIKVTTGEGPNRVSTLHLFDWNAVLPTSATVPTLLSMMVRWLGEFREQLVEEAILAGHDRIEVQVEGHPREIRTVPTWREAPVKRFKIERARRRRGCC